MNAAIFSFVTMSDDSVVASVHLTKFVSGLLGLKIYSKGDQVPNDLDVLLIVNGAYAFAGQQTLEMLASAIDSADRVVWIQQDYTIIPPKGESGAESPFRKAFRNRHERGASAVDYWTTCEPYSRPGKAASGHICGPDSFYVNWNALAFRPTRTESVGDERLLYYGAFRKDRASLFRRYFADPQLQTVISCPNGKFIDAGFVNEKITHVGKIDLDSISSFGLGLYLDDKRSHKENHSPANRFYEMLSRGLPMVFPSESATQLEKHGINVDDFIGWQADLESLMARRNEIKEMQHERWFDLAAKTKRELSDIVTEKWERYIRR